MKIGRGLSTAIAAHAGLKSAVHGVAAEYLAKTSQEAQDLSDAEIPDPIARDTEVTTAVADEATARALAIAGHASLASVHHTKFTITEHDVVARHPLANLDSTIVSETDLADAIAALIADYYIEATGDVALLQLKLIPEATLADFLADPATGNMTSPANATDENLATSAVSGTLGKYVEIDFGKWVIIDQWRIYGEDSQLETGDWKLQYYDTSYHDWVTGIPTNKAVWTSMASETPVICNKVKLIITTVDGQGNSRCGELEVYHS